MMIILPDDMGTRNTAHANKRKARMKQIPTSIIGESSPLNFLPAARTLTKTGKRYKKYMTIIAIKRRVKNGEPFCLQHTQKNLENK